MSSSLIQPHGGDLVDLLVPEDHAKDLRTEGVHLPSITLNDRQICDLELLLNGGFSPLKGYLGQKDYASVLSKMRLADGTLWPMPITLDVS